MGVVDTPLRSYAAYFLLVVLFLVLVVFAIAIRDRSTSGLINATPSETSFEAYAPLSCNNLPACFRIGTKALSNGAVALKVFLTDALDVETNRWFPDTFNIQQKEAAISKMVQVLFIAFVLSPILLAVCASFASFPQRLLAMIVVFMPILGWARSGDIFQGQLFWPYDFTAIGYLFLLYVLLSEGYLDRIFPAAVALVAGQLIFEHLGLITGVAIAARHYFVLDPGRSRRERSIAAIRTLTLLGGLSVAVALTIVTVIRSKYESLSFAKEGEPFSWLWAFYGRANWDAIYDVFENLLDLMVYPVVFGIVLGAISILVWRVTRSAPNPSIIHSQQCALAWMCVGFFMAISVGLFISGLRYEMGRQVAPLMCLLGLFSAKSVELYVARRAGHASAS